jgi:hypothetical protein
MYIHSRQNTIGDLGEWWAVKIDLIEEKLYESFSVGGRRCRSRGPLG